MFSDKDFSGIIRMPPRESRIMMHKHGMSVWIIASQLCFIVLSCVSVLTDLRADDVSVYENSHPEPILLAHYMPWFSARPSDHEWGWHWTMGHFDPEQMKDERRSIASRYYPRIGPYDSSDTHVLEYHLLLMKLAGIQGVIVDWYGLTDLHDYPELHHNTTQLLKQCEKLGMTFVICYEDQTIASLVDAGRLRPTEKVSHAREEIEWLGQYWFRSPSYGKYNQKPILLSFGHAGLTDNEWSECLSKLSTSISYFSQDYCRVGAQGGFDWPSPQKGLARQRTFILESSQWKTCIPVVFPRFHDIYEKAQVHESYGVINDADGKTFCQTLDSARQVDPAIIQIATWNDWGEGTQIEPSMEFGFRDLQVLRDRRYPKPKKSLQMTDKHWQLPETILSLRRLAGVDSVAIDKAVSAILAGKLADACELLDAVVP